MQLIIILLTRLLCKASRQEKEKEKKKQNPRHYRLLSAPTGFRVLQ